MSESQIGNFEFNSFTHHPSSNKTAVIVKDDIRMNLDEDDIYALELILKEIKRHLDLK